MSAKQQTAFFSPWRVIYVVTVAGVLLYVAVWAADTKFLRAQTGTATVSGKEHQAMRQTYTMERIGNVNRAVPRTIPEQYVLNLSLEGKSVEYSVEKELFRRVEIGQNVRVVYEQRRVTGGLHVLSMGK